MIPNTWKCWRSTLDTQSSGRKSSDQFTHHIIHCATTRLSILHVLGLKINAHSKKEECSLVKIRYSDWLSTNIHEAISKWPFNYKFSIIWSTNCLQWIRIDAYTTSKSVSFPKFLNELDIYDTLLWKQIEFVCWWLFSKHGFLFKGCSGKSSTRSWMKKGTAVLSWQQVCKCSTRIILVTAVCKQNI